MSTFEDLFNTSVLDVIAPAASLGFPSQDEPETFDDWLARLEEESVDRKMAFFDENLDFLLILRLESPSDSASDDKSGDPVEPPVSTLSFLAHLQVSYDASYISSVPTAANATPEIGRPPVPPRTTSIPRHKTNTLAIAHPSIFPPNTPHPIPSTAESDRRYVQAEGTPICSGVWGENAVNVNGGKKSAEDFALVWSPKEKVWLAVFKMSMQVAFLVTKVSDPLLCLTVSATLREKPLAITPPRQALATLIEKAGGLPASAAPSAPAEANGDDDDSDASDITGLEEINLLEGLGAGPTFSSKTSPLVLPSTRLGPSVRRQVYSLPAVSPPAGTPRTAASSASVHRPGGTSSHPTLRKSFRKTLRTVSGFRVRMRTVFVPYFMLPQTGGLKRVNGRKAKVDDQDEDNDVDDPEAIHERELRESGSEEHTVVLCVEVENSGESSSGFAVEGVDVTVGGDDAKTTLIGWGEAGLMQPEKVFPLLVGPNEQYNLLYAVAFLRSPETDEFSLARGSDVPGTTSAQDLQRAVTIIINGRPYDKSPDNGETENALSYPTHPFPSRWNCVLDLSSQTTASTGSGGTGGGTRRDALPTPASPFPVTAPRSAKLPGNNQSNARLTPQASNMLSPRTSTPGAVAGNQRYTLSAMDYDANENEIGRLRAPASPVNYRSGTSMLNPANQRDTQAQSGMGPPTPTAQGLNPIVGSPQGGNINRASYLPPSIAAQSFVRSPTTYGPLSAGPSFGMTMAMGGMGMGVSQGHGHEDSLSSMVSYDGVPPTPAYPAYPVSPLPPSTPHWQAPIAGLQSGVAVGPSVEIRRERGAGGGGVGIPQTPGPRVGAGGGFVQMQEDGLLRGVGVDGDGEPIVVSVGLLPTRRRKGRQGTNGGINGEEALELGRIYPLDQFTLDIFVFNRSSGTRRFEVNYPDRRRRRKEQGVSVGDDVCPGIVPLENRIRVGPLLPSTCQSVRMDFLALTPGVHAIDTLTLTDIQSGFTVNLRSVIDIVVHEHETSDG